MITASGAGVNSFSFSGVRAVAIIEAVKAVMLLVVGFGVLTLINHDVEAFAAQTVKHLHLNPAHHYPRIFIDAARHVTNTHLWLIASLALTDAVIRLIEAVGLWRGKVWGTRLGIVTAAIYLPIELYEMIVHLTWLKSVTFVTNVIIVVYLGYVLYSSKRRTVSS